MGVLSLIPLYIIDFKFFDKLNIGLQRKIALAKERGHVARGMIVKEDAKRLVVNNSQSAYSYWAARYTYTVDGKEYRKRFSCDKRHSTRSELRTIINVYWLDDPNKPFWDYSSDSLEMVGKIVIAFTLVPLLGYTGVIVAEPLVWFIMVIPLLVKIYTMPVLRKQPVSVSLKK